MELRRAKAEKLERLKAEGEVARVAEENVRTSSLALIGQVEQAIASYELLGDPANAVDSPFDFAKFAAEMNDRSEVLQGRPQSLASVLPASSNELRSRVHECWLAVGYVRATATTMKRDYDEAARSGSSLRSAGFAEKAHRLHGQLKELRWQLGSILNPQG